MLNLITRLLRRGDYQGSGRQDDGCAILLVFMAAGAAVLATTGTVLVQHL